MDSCWNYAPSKDQWYDYIDKDLQRVIGLYKSSTCKSDGLFEELIEEARSILLRQSPCLRCGVVYNEHIRSAD